MNTIQWWQHAVHLNLTRAAALVWRTVNASDASMKKGLTCCRLLVIHGYAQPVQEQPMPHQQPPN